MKVRRQRKMHRHFEKTGVLYFDFNGKWYKCTTSGALGLKEIFEWKKANKVENMNLFDSDTL